MAICKWVQPRLVGFFLGELPRWQASLLARHIGRCPECLDQLHSLRETLVVFNSPAAAGAGPAAAANRASRAPACRSKYVTPCIDRFGLPSPWAPPASR